MQKCFLHPSAEISKHFPVTDYLSSPEIPTSSIVSKERLRKPSLPLGTPVTKIGQAAEG